MLSASQIVVFLQHDDRAVRELALRYLAESNDPSPATADDLWRAMDHLGERAGEYFLEALAPMPQTENSIGRTLKALSASPNDRNREYLEKVLANLRYGLLMRFGDMIEGSTGLSDELRDHLKKRTELASVNVSDLWDRLEQHALEYEQANDASGKIDPRLAQRLVEALARNPEAAQWAVAAMNDAKVPAMQQIWCVALLGEIRYAQATELIVQKLLSDIEADFLLEAAVLALAKIGTAEVVRSVTHRFRKAEIPFRYHLSDVIRRIKLPQSETSAIELLSVEQEKDIRTLLANALCDLGCTRPEGLKLIGDMITSGNWNTQMLPLHTDAGALFTMLGKTKPDAPVSTLAAPAPVFRDMDRDEELEPLPTAPAPPPPGKTKPIRRSATKVGRNDPCPCGSGKKYKKCCGR